MLQLFNGGNFEMVLHSLGWRKLSDLHLFAFALNSSVVTSALQVSVPEALEKLFLWLI
jgi:hypothetical protein